MAPTIATPLPKPELAEPDRVLLWRIAQLVDAGYSDAGAIEIACSEVDLHEAVDLARRGCPEETAFRILF